MKDIFQKNKKVFLSIGVLVGAVILYKLLFSGGSPAASSQTYDPTAGGLVTEISASPADAIVGRDLLAMLARLKAISLDASIFTDPVFVSLQDKNVPIGSQPFGKALGRRNPFSDFGKSAAAAPVGSGTVPPSAFGTPAR